MQIKVISADFAVAGQLDAAALAGLAESGFKSVINNRPDGEGGRQQPSARELEQSARAAGLEYAHLPVTMTSIAPADIAGFRALLASLPKPILAFCASGKRSALLYEAATAGVE